MKYEKKKLLENTSIYFEIRNIYYRLIDVYFNIDKHIRLLFSNNKYEKLRKLKGKYEGERCFIIATGPSLDTADLDLLKNEICFGCNSIVGAYGSTEWRPRFYGIQDLGVYKKLKDKIDYKQYDYFFYGSLIENSLLIDADNVIGYPLNLLGHTVALFKGDIDHIHYGFSEKCEIEVVDGFSITYSLFQIAIYLGFKEIIFLGQDCNYSSDGSQQHFMGDRIKTKTNPHWKVSGKLICNAFEYAKPFCDKHNIKVLNATRGGMFDVFPRVKLEDIVQSE